ncbi:hemagglutinin [Salinivibrio sp. PR6]|uniref:M4 family metallopeptidase n=1 Tax=Salinivibrio sp. PR6 TaxID=1909485 RepID=UPI0009889B58|nr:M4 family metallopeptidase [Salinivibrio sp. PR6]OOE82152.1 hemagglutinin [Salinivibrio sp. PR6]
MKLSKLTWLIASSVVASTPALSAELINVTDDAMLSQVLDQPAGVYAPSGSQANPLGFKEVKRVTLPNGKVKVRYQQTYQGVPVIDTAVVATEKQGQRSDVYGTMAQGVANDITSISPALNSQAALEAAKAAFTQNQQTITSAPFENENTRLVVKLDDEQKAQLVYIVDFFIAGDDPSRPFYMIDADTGEILKHWDGINHATAVGTGPGGNEKTGQYIYGTDYDGFPIDKTGTTCTLENDKVKTVDLENGTTGSTAFTYPCTDSSNYNDERYVNGAYSALNDAHYFGNVVFDMYQDWMNTAPLTFQLTMRVHYGNDYENAFWNGSSMTFGDGKSTFYPLVDINVSAHEVSHGFTEQNSGLIYADMSGGINEAFSDIAGEAAEYYMHDEVDWVVGADIFKGTGGLRYFDQPSRDGKSIDDASQYRDGMNVHYSSGVYNRAFYLLANKANWNVRKGFEVFTTANQLYWTASSTFDQGACGVVKATQDLAYNAQDVIDAFNTVGVDASCGDNGGNVLQPNQPVTGLSGGSGSETFFTFTVDSSRNVNVAMSGGTGDADLYVKAGSKPTTNNWDCRPYDYGNDETCRISAQEGTEYHVMVRGYRSYSNVSLERD